MHPLRFCSQQARTAVDYRRVCHLSVSPQFRVLRARASGRPKLLPWTMDISMVAPPALLPRCHHDARSLAAAARAAAGRPGSQISLLASQVLAARRGRSAHVPRLCVRAVLKI